jgi:hypothetical protein
MDTESKLFGLFIIVVAVFLGSVAWASHIEVMDKKQKIADALQRGVDPTVAACAFEVI